MGVRGQERKKELGGDQGFSLRLEDGRLTVDRVWSPEFRDENSKKSGKAGGKKGVPAGGG